MTIQRTVLFSIAGLMMTANANAQCSRTRSVVITRSYHHPISYVRPYVTRRPHYSQTVELPPAPSSVIYGGFTQTDELAARLEMLMNELCLDLYYNYSHNPDFQATYADAYSLFQTAQYIHAAEHNCDRQTLVEKLGGADALFHHIQECVQGWTRYPRRQIGTLGIVTKMEMAEDALHQLMEDVGINLTTGLEVPPVPQGLSVPPPLAQ